MAFECSIAPDKIRTFSSSMKLLARVSDDMTVETEEDRIIFSALGASQAGFTRFVFLFSFFSSFTPARRMRANKRQRRAEETGEQESREREQTEQHSFHFKEKISAKGAASAFRFGLSSVAAVTIKITDHEEEGFSDIDRHLKSKARADSGTTSSTSSSASASASSLSSAGALVITLHSIKSGIFRTFSLSFLDQMLSPLEPTFRRRECRAVARVEWQKMHKWLDFFQRDVEELSLTFKEHEVRFRSYRDLRAAISDAEGEAGKDTKKATQNRQKIIIDYTAPAADFKHYQIDATARDEPVVFCYQELRLLVDVCKNAGSDVWLLVQGTGQPIMATNTESPLPRPGASSHALHDDNASAVIDDSAADSRSHSSHGFTTSSSASSSSSSSPSSIRHYGVMTYMPSIASWSGEIILSTLSKKLLEEGQGQLAANEPQLQQAPYFPAVDVKSSSLSASMERNENSNSVEEELDDVKHVIEDDEEKSAAEPSETEPLATESFMDDEYEY